jgi:hypothetical protein
MLIIWKKWVPLDWGQTIKCRRRLKVPTDCTKTKHLFNITSHHKKRQKKGGITVPAHTIKEYGRSRIVASLIQNYGIRWQWSASHSCHFTPRESTHHTRIITYGACHQSPSCLMISLGQCNKMCWTPGYTLDGTCMPAVANLWYRNHKETSMSTTVVYTPTACCPNTSPLSTGSPITQI